MPAKIVVEIINCANISMIFLIFLIKIYFFVLERNIGQIHLVFWDLTARFNYNIFVYKSYYSTSLRRITQCFPTQAACNVMDANLIYFNEQNDYRKLRQDLKDS